MAEKQVKISSIKVKKRHRKTFGDIAGLAKNIKTHGLLQANGVSKGMTLLEEWPRKAIFSVGGFDPR